MGHSRSLRSHTLYVRHLHHIYVSSHTRVHEQISHDFKVPDQPHPVMLAFLSLVSLQLSDNQNSQHSLHCVTMLHLHLYTPDNPPPLGSQGFMVFWSRLPVLPVLSCLFVFFLQVMASFQTPVHALGCAILQILQYYDHNGTLSIHWMCQSFLTSNTTCSERKVNSHQA